MNTEDLIKHLRFNVSPISDDYVRGIAEVILDDVNEDIECSADVDYNDDDIRLAVGRVLSDRLGVDNTLHIPFTEAKEEMKECVSITGCLNMLKSLLSEHYTTDEMNELIEIIKEKFLSIYSKRK